MATIMDNGKVSFDFVVAVSLNESSSKHEEEIVKWFLEQIKSIKHTDVYEECDIANNWNWNIIHSIKDDEYDNDPDVSDYEDGDKLNTIYILIHVSKQERLYEDKDMLIKTEFSEPSMRSSDISNVLSSTPDVVCKIGVSGVTRQYMNILWNNMISEDPGNVWPGHPGKGFMLHPAYKLFDHGWDAYREKSFGFCGWTESKKD
jgi:hypothetical protein